MMKIGTNFSYKGERFLDQRQGEATTKKDLLNWNTLIPKGFMVMVEGMWYLYDPTKIKDPETGYFHPFFAQELSDSDNTTLSATAIRKEIEELWKEMGNFEKDVNPLSFSTFIGGGNYLKGQSVTPIISWILKKRGEEITPDTAMVNDSEDGISPDKRMYSSSTPISTTKSYTVKVTSGVAELSRTCTYSFQNKRFFGVSEKENLTSEDIQNLEYSDFGTNSLLSLRNFNCSGRKYPWFCIPLEYYSPSLQVWVGGLRVTDIIESNVEVTNPYEQTSTYKCIRLGNIQTGNIAIEIK